VVRDIIAVAAGRAKSPAQVIAEVERLYQLGWRSWV
jgi:hypothetical protein